jgi:hypothetical protein
MLHRVCASTSIALALFVAVEASAALPQRTFVASYGLDANPCSLTAPCRGFQAAINAVAAGGEVVAIDTAGYGAMEIHKSVSVIVPPGVHAGLSPGTGIPLPGFPGQFGVVLIDIQDTDVVVLRGLNINHQGTVTGGIEWISTKGGTLHIENAVVNGFPKEGIYVQAPNGRLIIHDSIIRNSGVGLYVGLALPDGVAADHLHIETSGDGIRLLDGVSANLSNCTFSANATAVHVIAVDNLSVAWLDRCRILADNDVGISLQGVGLGTAAISMSGTTMDASIGRSVAHTFLRSLGNNSTYLSFDLTTPPK